MNSNHLSQSSSCGWLHPVLLTRSLSGPKYRLKITQLNREPTMLLLLLLTLTLGVVAADAGNLLYEDQSQEQLPPEDGLLCPDQASKCSNTATCCKLSSGKWGCCPFVRATCCEDNVHCCPSGYSCNKNEGHCVRAINNETIPWASKEASAISVSSSSSEEAISLSNHHVCPDRVSHCSPYAACCRTHSGSYRCCPYPHNVCCSNGYHCCSRCTICNWLKFRCIPGVETEKWETVGESTPLFLASEMAEAVEKSPANVLGEGGDEEKIMMFNPYEAVWCDRKYYCRNGQTCCRHPHWKWGCCPHKCGTCCRGGKYCCPAGTRCCGRYCYWT